MKNKTKTRPRFAALLGKRSPHWKTIALGDWVTFSYGVTYAGKVTAYAHQSNGDVHAHVVWEDGIRGSYRISELVRVPKRDARRLARAEKKAAKK